MGVDEGRRDEIPAHIDLTRAALRKSRLDCGNAGTGDGDVDLAAVRQGGVAEDEIHAVGS
jgi:hypothetical protein